jgi:hypothetical protein
MQDSVDCKVRRVGGQSLALGPRLPFDHTECDGDIAPMEGVARGEGQDIGRLVLTAELPVQLPQTLIAGKKDRQGSQAIWGVIQGKTRRAPDKLERGWVLSPS